MKIKAEILKQFETSEKYYWAMYQLREKNQVSDQTVQRWLKNNTRELLIYPNLLILLEATGKSEIREIVEIEADKFQNPVKQSKLL